MSERPSFDPSRVHVPESERLPGPTGPLTLTPRQVNDLVRGAIVRHVPATLHVLGEVGDFSRPRSGHLYFSLKDASSELRCVMWRSAARRMKFELQPGMEVIATGGLEVYTPRGTYQLIVRRVEPRGVGALELAFRQLREKLEQEGLFDPARKRPLPRIPRRIAVITSPTGAAIRDILQTLRRRFSALEILLFPVHVQGEAAAPEIAQAIGRMNEQAEALGGIDVAIVGRGGGSLEDLWAFNEEAVARAIAASRIPIVSAVGHEIDVSISDLVADVRAATPTAGAELVAPVMSDLLDGLAAQLARVGRWVVQRHELSRRALDALLARDCMARPLRLLREREQRIDELHARMRSAATEHFRRAHQRIGRADLSILRFAAGATFVRLRHNLMQQRMRALRAAERLLHDGERRTDAAIRRLQHAAPTARLERYDERLGHVAGRLAIGLHRHLRARREALGARVGALRAHDPQRILERGYSVTRDARTRKVIRSVAQVRDKQRLISQLADGEVRSTADDPRQPNLFE